MKTEKVWKRILTPEQYRVLRERGTERPFLGRYTDHFSSGAYRCAGCKSVLFKSDDKFESSCGWPAFSKSASGERINHAPDDSSGVVRTEAKCAGCDGHLGHVFYGEKEAPSGVRYCINSAALAFEPAT